MKGSILVIGVFGIGCLCGYAGLVPSAVTDSDIATWFLYLLMFQVGIGIGSDVSKMRLIASSFSMKMFLLPFGTMVGTLVFSALASFFLGRWSVPDCLAVGSGFAYYSMSSILITDLKEAAYGVQAAAELGAIALLTNILRELIGLACLPLLAKKAGPVAAMAAVGVSSMDVALPAMTRVCGQSVIPASVLHGLALDLSVPLFVSFFCSL